MENLIDSELCRGHSGQPGQVAECLAFQRNFSSESALQQQVRLGCHDTKIAAIRGIPFRRIPFLTKF